MTSIDTSSWKEFRIGDLFESVNGDTDIKKEDINDIGYYVITSGIENNGIAGKSDIESKIISKNSITIDMFGNAFYRDFEYKMVTHGRIFALIPKNFNLTKEVGLYFTSCFLKYSKIFSYTNMCSFEKIKNYKILLPYKEVEGIDFEYMENYIRELESERIRELEDYLAVTGLNDYELTEEDKQILSLSTKTGFNKNSNTKNVIPNGLKMKFFSINNLFKLQKVFNKLSKENLSDDFEFPTYSSDSKNNGILGYSEKPEFICDDKIPVYVIFGDHTRTLNIARKSFSVLDNVKVLIPCINNDDVLLYIISLWGLQIPNLGYSRHWKVAKECKLPLPIKVTKDGEPLIDKEYKYHEDGFIPDFEYMEKYIRVIEKKVIKNIYDDKGLILSVIKKIVNEVRYDK